MQLERESRSAFAGYPFAESRKVRPAAAVAVASAVSIAVSFATTAAVAE